MDPEKKENSDHFLSLLLPNQKGILGYILSYVPNFADADDIFQNTLSILWKKFDQYKPETDFVAWSLTTARFEIMNYYRKSKKEGKLHFDETLQTKIDEESATASRQFNHRMETLRECIKKLTPDDLQLVKMRYEQEMPFTKIGQRLGISSPAALKKVSGIHGRLIRCIRLKMAMEG